MTDRIIPIQRSLAIPARQTGPLTDRRSRPLRDLRISVTDRCNFRCTYCMPKAVFDADYAFLPQGELLTFEEITRLARVFHANGVEKIRLTGGEPLLRKGLPRLVEMLSKALPTLDLTLTTNGSALRMHAPALAAAGLKRVTVSLDSLDEATFRAMNDVDFPAAKVLDAIDAAADAGLTPIKINMVVKRGVNAHQVVDMARRFRNTGHIVRFIEFMDVGATNGWRMDDVVSAGDIVQAINSHYPLVPVDANYAGEVAERWRYLDGAGEIGVIASVTQAFCSTCNRARVSTDGKLYTCLFASAGYDLRNLLRGGASDDGLSDAIAGIWQQRADRYSEVRTLATTQRDKVEMSFIGG
jgi:GTP 3',8-cyclase